MPCHTAALTPVAAASAAAAAAGDDDNYVLTTDLPNLPLFFYNFARSLSK